MGKSNVERKYESVTNGKMKQEWENLKKKAENKEFKSKEEYQEYKETKELMEKIQKNLPMVENLLESREKYEDLRNTIIEELAERANIDKENEQIENEKNEIARELEALMEEEEKIIEDLKNDSLSDADKEKLQNRRNEISEQKKQNDEKYLENAKKQPKSYDKTRILAGMSTEELENKAILLKSKIGRCEYFMYRLLKGEELENIKLSETTKDWKDQTKEQLREEVKKYTCPKEEKDKMARLTEVLRAENEKKVSIEEPVKANEIEEDIESSVEDKEEESKEMIEVSEFDQKHPRIAAVKNWFKNIVQKVTIKAGKKDKAEKEDKGIKEEDLKKIEEGLTDKVEALVEPKEESRRDSFLKDLKFFEDADISKIAESGYKEVQQQHQHQSKVNAIQRLIDEKKRAGEGKDGGSIAKLEKKLADMNGEDKGDGR